MPERDSKSASSEGESLSGSAQVFRPRANAIARAVVIFVPAALLTTGYGWFCISRSTFLTHVGEPLPQPVPFSHEHHVAGLGIDCRYCHTSVETTAFAGMPPTETCMTCHSQVWKDAPVLQPVRASFQNGTPLRWTRVHDLPGYVYFNHSIHVSKGVGCASCHGRVDQMPITWKTRELEMRWCLDCHRHPEEHLRPRSEVFDMAYQNPRDQSALGRELAAQYHLRSEAGMTDCYTCHR
jgi:hypothetical protein